MAHAKGQAKEKEPATSVTSVYLHVVEDVIQSVREDFQNENVDESVLVELRQLWELKMMQAGVIQGTTSEETAAPASTNNALAQVHDLNVPYEPTDELQTPTMDLLFPPTPLPMTPIAATPLPMTPQIDVTTSQMEAPSVAATSSSMREPFMYQYIPPGPSEVMDGGGGSLDLDTKLGRPASFMQQPAPWMNKKPRDDDVIIDMNATYEEGQEEDEAGNEQTPITKDFFTLATGKRKREELATGPWLSGNYIPQQDGVGDVPPRYQGVAEEDYNESGGEDLQPAADVVARVFKVEKAARDSDAGDPPSQ